MCGISGILDIGTDDPAALGAVLRRMSSTLTHRGPDDDGIWVGDAVGLACRRLSIVDPPGGRQPVSSEDDTVIAVFNGELFDHESLRHDLRQRGHHVRSRCDSEVLVHLWEDHGVDMLHRLDGQFAFALVDRERRVLILARDHFGIAPLYWARTDTGLLFASEIKAILASGLVAPAIDLEGIDNLLVTYCLPGTRTAFEGIRSLLPGRCLAVRWRASAGGNGIDIQERRYWDLDFPDLADGDRPIDSHAAEAQFAARLEAAVERRLRADVPVSMYLSGGVDSGTVLAAANRQSQAPLTAFTASIGSAGADEASAASRTATVVGSALEITRCDPEHLARSFPAVVVANDSPVVDPTAGALLSLSAAVRNHGHKVVLSGEGADEALAGYVWFRVHRLLRAGRARPFPLVQRLTRAMLHAWFPRAPRGAFRRIDQLAQGPHAHLLVYHLTSFGKWRFLRDEALESLGDHSFIDDLGLDLERIRRWHPLDQSLYFEYKTQLPGLLLSQRGDRTAMANSVEVRYPFLDRELVELCAGLPPRYKLRGRHDKWLLRRYAEKHLPRDIAWRRKQMFRSSFYTPFFGDPPPWLSQLLSEASLQRTALFDVARVRRALESYRSGRRPGRRPFLEMALAAVVGVQLWHHFYIGGDLCELSS